MPSLSIVHVTAPARFGGLESVVRLLAAGQRRRGHLVRVVAILSEDGHDHPFVASLRAEGIEVTVLRVGARQYLAERRGVAAVCREAAADVVHTHGYRPDVVDSGAARALGIATVTTLHGITGTAGRARAYLWLQRRALRRFDAVVSVSVPLAERMRAGGVPAARIHVLPNGFAPRADPLDRAAARAALGLGDERAIGWVGRLSIEKGGDVAVEAMAKLGDRASRLVVIGEGPEAEPLRARALALGVADRIRWFGALADAGRYFGAFDAFLLSSRTEGTPMALLEAMAAGLPIVATRVGGVPDVVDERSAWLVPSEDPGAIAAALTAMAGSPDEARRRGIEARERVARQFGVEAWLDAYDDIYRSVVAARRRSHRTGEGAEAPPTGARRSARTRT